MSFPRVARSASRLVDEDRDAMRRAVRTYLAGWPAGVPLTADARTAMLRLAVHAIGCSDDDLRDVELDERDALVDEVIAQVRP
jgi:hypothetical protein